MQANYQVSRAVLDAVIATLEQAHQVTSEMSITVFTAPRLAQQAWGITHEFPPPLPPLDDPAA